jgi:hypothetical protein
VKKTNIITWSRELNYSCVTWDTFHDQDVYWLTIFHSSIYHLALVYLQIKIRKLHSAIWLQCLLYRGHTDKPVKGKLTRQNFKQNYTVLVLCSIPHAIHARCKLATRRFSKSSLGYKSFSTSLLQTKGEVLGRTNHLIFLSLHTDYLIKHRPHRKQCREQFFYCCVCVATGMCLPSRCLAMGLGRDR